MILFPPFHASSKHWRAVDDRIRGGSSTSYIEPIYAPVVASVGKEEEVEEEDEKAGLKGLEGGEGKGKGKGKEIGVRIYGNLDTQTLGGAGFASQCYTFPQALHLPTNKYSGIYVKLLPPGSSTSSSSADAKAVLSSNEKSESESEKIPSPTQYTLVLKTGIPATRPDGRKESTLSYEYTFPYPPSSSPSHPTPNTHPNPLHLLIPFPSFLPHYRGRPLPPTSINPPYKPLDPDGEEGVTELSFMCRSGFGRQEGEWEVRVGEVGVVERKGGKGEGRGEKRVGRERRRFDAGKEERKESEDEEGSWMGAIVDMVGSVIMAVLTDGDADGHGGHHHHR